MHKMRHLLVCALGFSICAADAGWIVEGRLTYSNHFMAPRQAATKESSFRVISDGCRSLIRTTRIDTGAYVESFIDAETIHTVYFSNRTNLQSSNVVVQTAEVAHREVPRDDSSNIGYLWLAYGSACYFDTRTTNCLAPLWVQDDPQLDINGFTMGAEWERDHRERLPRRVVYFNDGFMRTQRGGVSIVEPWRPPFDRGFKHAIFEAWNGTNVNGVFIPTEFVFTRNGVRPDGKGGFELSVVTHTEAKAISIREFPDTEISFPGFAGTIGIADYRFMRSNPAVSTILYKATNGAWPDQKQAGKVYERQLQVEAKLGKAKKASIPSHERRWVVVALLAIFSIGTLLVLLKGGLRRPRM